jgi:hypothetical protein
MNEEAGEKPPIPMWGIIAAAVILIAFVGWLGWKNFGPQDPPLSKENVAAAQTIESLAKKSGGDWGKLTPDEQASMKKLAGPMAPMVLQSEAQKFKK